MIKKLGFGFLIFFIFSNSQVGLLAKENPDWEGQKVVEKIVFEGLCKKDTQEYKGKIFSTLNLFNIREKAPTTFEKVQESIEALKKTGDFEQVSVLKENLPDGKMKIVYVFKEKESPKEYDGQELECKKVGVVEVIGLSRMTRTQFFNEITVKPGVILKGGLSDSFWRLDINSLWKTGQFDNIWIEGELLTDSTAKIIYHVKEKKEFDKIIIDGVKKIKTEEVIEKVTHLKRGQDFSQKDLENDIEDIKKFYRNQGYYNVRTESSVEETKDRKIRVNLMITEGSLIEVRSVRIFGSKQISEEEILKLLRRAVSPKDKLQFINRSGLFDFTNKDALTEYLAQYYKEKGYQLVRISSAFIQFSSDLKYADLIFTLKEGPLFKIGDIKIQSESVYPKPEAEIYKNIPLKKGDPLLRIRDAMVYLETIYKDAGYPFVKVSFEELNPDQSINVLEQSIDVEFKVVPGKKAKIRFISIVGNTKTKESYIRGRLGLKEGSWYRLKNIKNAEQLLQKEGVFDSVELEEQQVDDQYVDLRIKIKERETLGLNLVMTFSPNYGGAGLQIMLRDDNFLGRGINTSARALLSPLVQNINLNVYIPDVFRKDSAIDLSLVRYFSAYPDFNRDSILARLSTLNSWNIEKTKITLGLGYQAEWVFGVNVKTTQQTLPSFLKNNFISSGPELLLLIDRMNDKTFFTNGELLVLRAFFSNQYMGANVNYVKANINARIYREITSWLTFKIQLESGFVYSLDGKNVPISERYYMGGPNDIRGINIFQAGPQVQLPSMLEPDAFSKPIRIGGNLSLLARFDLDFHLYGNILKVGPFVDIGNAINLEPIYCQLSKGAVALSATADPCQFSLHVTPGIEFKVFSPIGPLRFGVAFNPNNSASMPLLVPYFSIGF